MFVYEILMDLQMTHQPPLTYYVLPLHVTVLIFFIKDEIVLVVVYVLTLKSFLS